MKERAFAVLTVLTMFGSAAMDDAGLVGGPMNWTAVNAITAGKTQLVIDEAARFAADG